MTAARDILPFRTKVFFGVGAIGEIFYLGMFNTFIGIYYNQAIGLSNSLIGIAIMLALLVDAVSDPVMGVVSDRWRSRLGRRHPFLFVAPVPLAIALYLIFNPPAAWTAAGAEGAVQTLLFAWLVFFTVISRLAITLYIVPHLALGGELTRDHNERSRLFSINAIFGYAMGALFAFSAWGYFLAGTTINAEGMEIPRHLDPDAYMPLVLTACGFLLGAIWLSAIGTLNQVSRLSQPDPDQPRFSLPIFYRSILGALKNRNYAFLIGGVFFFMIATGLYETFTVFVNTYFWELVPEDIRWFGLFAAPGAVAGALASPVLMRRFDRRPVLVGALLLMVVASQLPVDLRLLGLMPSNDSLILLPLLIGNFCVLTFSISLAAVAILSMLGDVIDQNEVATGERQEGLFYSARALVGKAAVSLGHLVAGVMLDIVVVLPFDAVPGELDADIVFRLGVVAGPIMGFVALVSVLFYARYDLTRKKHDAFIAELDARKTRADAAEPVPGGDPAIA
ncbi:MFS transporter [Parasphingopyxis algicola]|uniref:MFS transporter n=1 Tax=Parasphingopyxis algicola TaxID=2026624 RepID=UPI0015A2DF82|nr:MFS transporter [Parasphingopyxis algicola]QLC25363.1 MFS transporter [Parasphingopyxis algicola]